MLGEKRSQSLFTSNTPAEEPVPEQKNPLDLDTERTVSSEKLPLPEFPPLQDAARADSEETEPDDLPTRSLTAETAAGHRAHSLFFAPGRLRCRRRR